MPRLLPITLLALTFACTATNQETSSEDSTAVDSIPVSEATNIPQVEIVENVEETESPQDTSQLATVYEQQVTLATNDEAKYYIVSITVSQYEGRVSATWHFDKNFSPRYYNDSWSFEGNEGTNEMMIENESVICLLESDNYVDEKWCAQTGGTKMEGEEDVTVSVLDAGYGTTANSSFNDRFSTLKSILREGEIISESPDSYVVRVESTISVGQEVTEYTEVDIPKVLYNELKQ